jgi:hypothetical protein
VNLLYNVKIIELLFHQIFGKKEKRIPRELKIKIIGNFKIILSKKIRESQRGKKKEKKKG